MMTADKVEEQAVRWLIELDSDQGSEERWHKLDAWLAMNPRNRAAFLRLAAAWQRSASLRLLRPIDGTVDPDLFAPQACTELPVAFAPLSSRRRPFQRALAATFAVVVLAAIAFGALRLGNSFDEDVYSTPVGGRERVALSDGSSIDLNTNSSVRVRYSSGGRLVTLVKGEALFTVARDARRPFDVIAGNTVVRVRGTAFTVRRRPGNETEVLVRHGTVQIGRTTNHGNVLTLSAGDNAKVRPYQVRLKRLSKSEVEERLAWIEGRLAFNGETLGDVVAEFNRYNRRRLVIADPAIAQFRISGRFDATDPVSFVTMLRVAVGVRASGPPEGGSSDGPIRLVRDTR